MAAFARNGLIALALLPATLLLAMAQSVPARADPAACEALAQRWHTTRASLATPQISSLLFAAADDGCVAVAREVLAAGGSVESRDRFGNMPLAHAALSGQVGMIGLLLAHQADIAARNVAGATALYQAAEKHQTDAGLFLLDHGADPRVPGRSSVSPLAAAAFNGDATLAAAVLAHGADPRAVDSTGKPAIVYAAAVASGPVVTLLLNAGVDVNARTQNDLTVLMWAAGHADKASGDAALSLVGDLLARGARIDDADDRGRTALMIAAERGHAAIVDLLLAHGADRGRRDKFGKDAADLAADATLRGHLQPG